MALGRYRVALDTQVERVLRESDGNMLALVEVRVVESGEVVLLEVFDPRLEPGEDGYAAGG